MSEHLVRVDRLKQIQRERDWNDAELARQCERSPQQVHSWWSSARLIGERLARSLEEALKLPRYWLDERPASVGTLSTGEVKQTYTSTPAKVQAIPKGPEALPVLQWGQLHKMLVEPNASIPESIPRLDTYAKASRAAKFIEMPDDSMSPVFQPGDHLLFDPTEVPRGGDTVLVRIPSGEYFVRTFRPKTATAWEAVALNGNYAPLSFHGDEAEVAAVMVEHRRYRLPQS